MIDILKALADESRLRILAQILKAEMCVCEIEQCLGLTQNMKTASCKIYVVNNRRIIIL